MRSQVFGVILCAMPVAAPVAHAAELRGGDLTLSFSRFEDDLIGPGARITFAKYALQGSAEIDLTPIFGVQIDASYFDFNAIDQSEASLGLHAIYNMDDATALGVYYARDDLLDEHVDYIGLEAARQFSTFDAEVHLGRAELGGDHATTFGLRTAYALQPGLSLGVTLDHLDFDGDSRVTQVGVGLDYALTDDIRLSGELGRTDLRLLGTDADDIFVRLGASYLFGAERGARFARRGLLDRLPGL